MQIRAVQFCGGHAQRIKYFPLHIFAVGKRGNVFDDQGADIHIDIGVHGLLARGKLLGVGSQFQQMLPHLLRIAGGIFVGEIRSLNEVRQAADVVQHMADSYPGIEPFCFRDIDVGMGVDIHKALFLQLHQTDSQEGLGQGIEIEHGIFRKWPLVFPVRKAHTALIKGDIFRCHPENTGISELFVVFC